MSRMVRSLAFSAAVLVLLNGACLLTTDDEDEFLRDLWASVDSLQVVAIEPSQVYFHCWMSVGDSCHEFERAIVDQLGTHVDVELRSKRPKALMCHDTIATIEADVTVTVAGGQELTFSFARTEGATLDTTLFVP
jgi:hypothetical protein